MESRGMSDRVKNAVTFEKKGFLQGNIVFELEGDNGEPISVWLENGFKPHVIEAKGKEAGGSNYLKWNDPLTGKPIFRRKLRHPAFGRYHFMRFAETFYVPLIEHELTWRTNRFMELDKVG